MQEQAKKQLLGLGLNPHEADAYLALVEHSPASAAFVAKKLKLSRSSVYAALERLTEKGLVTTTYRNEVRQFTAEPPSAIEDLLEREQRQLAARFESLKGLAGTLSALGRGHANVPNIIFFEGEDSLKKIYLGMLRAAPKNATMLVMRDEFKWEKEWSFLSNEEWKERVRRLRGDNNIRAHVLINDSKKERALAKYYRGRKGSEFRYLPKGIVHRKFVQYVLGDTVAILSLEQNLPVGIRIINRHLAENFAQTFEALWVNAKKP